MTGRVALHGGGEFLPGDEPFLAALLRSVADDRGVADRPLRIAIVPVAAARHRPHLAAEFGQETFRRVAPTLGLEVDAEPSYVIDAASASDASLATALEAADLIYLPGGDPDLVPATLAGSRAWEAIVAAHRGGATVAGASAGAMGLAPRTWTRHGFTDGLGLVSGLVVVPHFDGFIKRGWDHTVQDLRRAGLGQLGLDERTGVISPVGGHGRWRVAGEGRAYWFPTEGRPVTAANGASLDLDGIRPG